MTKYKNFDKAEESCMKLKQIGWEWFKSVRMRSVLLVALLCYRANPDQVRLGCQRPGWWAEDRCDTGKWHSPAQAKARWGECQSGKQVWPLGGCLKQEKRGGAFTHWWTGWTLSLLIIGELWILPLLVLCRSNFRAVNGLSDQREMWNVL